MYDRESLVERVRVRFDNGEETPRAVVLDNNPVQIDEEKLSIMKCRHTMCPFHGSQFTKSQADARNFTSLRPSIL